MKSWGVFVTAACLVAFVVSEEELSEEEIAKHVKVFVTHEMDDEKCELWTQVGDHIYWTYEGKLTDGSVFDSGKFEATIGAGHVIKGVDYAMRDMCVGERRRMTIQPEWGYGSEGTMGIPPNAVLIFKVQLLKVKRPDGRTEEFKNEL